MARCCNRHISVRGRPRRCRDSQRRHRSSCVHGFRWLLWRRRQLLQGILRTMKLLWLLLLLHSCGCSTPARQLCVCSCRRRCLTL